MLIVEVCLFVQRPFEAVIGQPCHDQHIQSKHGAVISLKNNILCVLTFLFLPFGVLFVAWISNSGGYFAVLLQKDINCKAKQTLEFGTLVMRFLFPTFLFFSLHLVLVNTGLFQLFQCGGLCLGME